MTGQDLPRKLAQRLDEGLDSLPQRVTYRLQAAREAAVERAGEGETLVASGASATLAGAGGPGWPARGVWRRMLAPAVAVVLVLLAMLYWQQAQRMHRNSGEPSDIDAELLAEELPVNAYLDQ